MTTTDIRKNLNSILKAIQENRILEAFEKYYHNDIIIYEKGVNRVGKQENRTFEQGLASHTIVSDLKVLTLLVDENCSAYECIITFSTDQDTNITKSHYWSFQKWDQGLIVKEEILNI
ncbi:hypothetical protein CYY_004748 [Polysphondylium violaceum]|uniref:SnoaL-like domain-containing protein n=1 Tax=Polysphondylium violaceum TaxID=133409 RepID=A0A8J4Q4U1_9MYCE|nr:hypothetical protein CYY_004748 [Polysphondylium violaceum]